MFASTEPIVHVHAGLSLTLSYYSFESIIGPTTQKAISKLKSKIEIYTPCISQVNTVPTCDKACDVILFYEIIIPYINATFDNKPHMSEVGSVKTPFDRALTFPPPRLSLPLLLLVILLPLCIREVTPASPLVQGVSWVSQSDLSCWMPYDRLFVKLLCSVCSLSPPLSLLTVSPLWIWRALLCLARLIGASVGPKRACTHLCSFCGSICSPTCPLLNFYRPSINFYRMICGVKCAVHIFFNTSKHLLSFILEVEWSCKYKTCLYHW